MSMELADALRPGTHEPWNGITGAVPTLSEVQGAVGRFGAGGAGDIAIFQFMTPLILGIFAAAFWVIFFNNRHMKSSGFWALSYTFGAIGFLTDLTRGALDNFLTSLIVNASFAGAACLFVTGVAFRYRRKPPIGAMAAVLGVMSGFLAYHWFQVPDANLRGLYLCAGCGLVLTLSWWMVDRRRVKTVDRILQLMVSLTVAQFAALPIVAIAFSGALLAVTGPALQLTGLLYFAVAATSLATGVVLFVALGMDIVVELQHRSDTDAMTGARNRLAFEIAAERAIAEAERRRNTVSLVVGDIDHFKSVNDTWGHACGDVIIKVFARVLTASCRRADVVGRIGGEEFCLLLPTAELGVAERVAQKARATFEIAGREALVAAVPPSGPPADRPMTASLGIAEWQAGETYSDLFARADAALYRAKNSGRNRVEGFSAAEDAVVVPFETPEQRSRVPEAA